MKLQYSTELLLKNTICKQTNYEMHRTKCRVSQEYASLRSRNWKFPKFLPPQCRPLVTDENRPLPANAQRITVPSPGNEPHNRYISRVVAGPPRIPIRRVRRRGNGSASASPEEVTRPKDVLPGNGEFTYSSDSIWIPADAFRSFRAVPRLRAYPPVRPSPAASAQSIPSPKELLSGRLHWRDFPREAVYSRRFKFAEFITRIWRVMVASSTWVTSFRALQEVVAL